MVEATKVASEDPNEDVKFLQGDRLVSLELLFMARRPTPFDPTSIQTPKSAEEDVAFLFGTPHTLANLLQPILETITTAPNATLLRYMLVLQPGIV